MGGIAATQKFVFVSDREAGDAFDAFLCLNAETGDEIWGVRYQAPVAPPGIEVPRLDYGNAPRATPQLSDKLVFFMGAFGNLTAAEIATGAIVWQIDLYGEFDVRTRSKWGLCCSPLLVDGMVIVGPGGESGGIVALEAATGKVKWKSPTSGAGHSSFITATLGGRNQIIGYDATSLGGWDPQNGKRLWTLVPPRRSDFNVGTPVVVRDQLLVATENNGARLYDFDAAGKINPKPIAQNSDLAPDSHTPVAVGSRIYGIWNELICLDANNKLAQVWSFDHDAFHGYGILIASPTRMLTLSQHGDLILFDITKDTPTILSKCKLFEDEKGIYAHPALIGSRLYLRTTTHILSLNLSPQ